MRDIVKLGKHVEPSIPPVLLADKEIDYVKMSCGGGMGGSVWYEYGKLLDPFEPMKVVRFKDFFTGEVKRLNTMFIVKIEPRKMVAIESDVTQNHNFHHRKSVHYYMMRRDQKYQLVDKCGVHPDKEDAELVKIDTIY